jgi:hypothetical protein
MGRILAPVTVNIRCEADHTIRPTFEFPVGTNLTGYQFNFLVTSDNGTILVDTNLIPVLSATLNHATVSAKLTHDVTKSFKIGKFQHYRFQTTDLFGDKDVYLYGPINAYVTAGSR